MIEYFFTICPIALLGLSLIAGAKRKNIYDNFMSYNYTNAIKAAACIIIIYVHIPNQFSNRIQDMIGSFAYVGVFAFFMISAYGCRYKVEQDKGYLSSFFKKRILSLFIPAIILNIAFFVLKKVTLNISVWRDLYAFNQYIYAILVAYMVFWCVWRFDRISNKNKDYVLCLICLCFSLLTYFTPVKLFFIWPTESVGFIFGVIMYKQRRNVLNFLSDKQLLKIITLGILSVALGLVYLKFKYVYFFGGFVIRVLLASVLLLFFFSITMGIELGSKTIQFLGNNSYSIYLGHLAVISWMSAILPNVSTGKFVFLIIACTIVISIPVTKVSNLLLKSILDRGNYNGEKK